MKDDDFTSTAITGARLSLGLLAFIVTLPLMLVFWCLGKLLKGRFEIEFR